MSDATRVSLDFRVIRTSELHLAPVRGCDDGEDAPATGVKGSAAYLGAWRAKIEITKLPILDKLGKIKSFM